MASPRDITILPSPATLSSSSASIHRSLPATGLGHEVTISHLNESIVPGLNQSSRSSRYYGFVTGGCTPSALAADHIVSEYDQNVSVHLPNESITTEVEDAALRMLIELLDLGEGWGHRIFTTGATASNILGLACGREAVVKWAGEKEGVEASVAKHGIVGAMKRAGMGELMVLTCDEHSSLRKACSVVGLGHDAVVDVGRAGSASGFDFDKLEQELSVAGRKSIIAVSCAEVNTGLFATRGKEDMERIRRLADEHGAWVHVDAAFGLMARVLDNDEEFAEIKKGIEGMELADSITGDGHKLLNVPYDCGFFFSKHLGVGEQVFQNPGAPYLSTSAASIPSPLSIGLENSRRFRALPVYANLVCFGKEGFREMLARQIRFSRRIARYMMDSKAFELLPPTEQLDADPISLTYMIVLFRAKDEAINGDLIKRINDQRKIYCSGTKWGGKPAVRFAVSNHQVDIEKDWPVVKEVLDSAILNK
ncbi:pyridoxal-dependent decarboxylase [Elsinoe ampelina]|uniref:Pyridoxal-dependent decarboxylase n=1 Tax=Elsinoe ampelina TaxID=302913 RepID=A0A6A6G100_9PEZI|nr:pyridoxal-dependent decarboxylase [Elsinoe ampelina]